MTVTLDQFDVLLDDPRYTLDGELVGPPTAVLTVLPSPAVVAHADASGSISNGYPLRYDFRWGDGHSTGLQDEDTYTHTYDQPGVYLVTLYIEDAVLGLSDEASVDFISRGSRALGHRRIARLTSRQIARLGVRRQGV